MSEVQRTHQYTIAKKNYESELAKLKSLQEIKRDLSKKRSLLKSEIDKHASGIQYYRVLNSKLSSLRLRASTVVTDIVFDKLIPQVSSFKKFALSLFISLSIALSLFLSNLYVISSFLLDKRIYDEVELKSTFNDIEIIGDTPEFE